MVGVNWKNWKSRTVPATVITGIAALFLLLSLRAKDAGPVSGRTAPEFELTDLGGNSVSLADYRGKVLLIDFWATWCVSCETELPGLKSLYKEFQPQGFELLAASVDEGGPEVVARFTTEREVPYRVVFADRNAVRRYNVYGLPAKFLVDHKGNLFRTYKPDTPIQDIEADIRTLLIRRTQ